MKLSWYFKKAYKKFSTDRCPLLASALVHATTFSLFPLLGLISLSVFILGSSEGVIDKVMPYLKQAFPVDINEIINNISLIKQIGSKLGSNLNRVTENAGFQTLCFCK